MNRSKNTLKAFTLIELLVVISIIALLLSIMLPSLNRARGAAMSIVCKTQLKDMGLAVHVYLTEQNGYMPSLAVPAKRWNNLLAGYMYGRRSQGNQNYGQYDFELFRCPYEQRKAEQKGYDGDQAFIAGVYGLYGMNQFFTGESLAPSTSSIPNNTNLDNCWRKYDDIRTPSTLPLFADTNSDGEALLNRPDGTGGCWWLSAKGPHPLVYTRFNYNGGAHGLGRNPDKWAFYGPSPNHNRKTNYLMADGHTVTHEIWPWRDHIGTDFHPKRNVNIKPPAPPREFYLPGAYPAQ